MPSEELRLDVETAWDDDELHRLEDALDDVDDQIRETGDGGDDKVTVDVEVQSGDALTELEALDSAIDDLNDRSISIGFDGFRDPDTSLNQEGRGSNFIDNQTGQFISSDEALTTDPIDDLLDQERSISVETDIDQIETTSTTVSPSSTTSPVTPDGRGPSGKREFGRVFSEDKISDDEIDIRFESAFDTQDVSDAMGLLDRDPDQFSTGTIGDNRSAFQKLSDNVSDAASTFMEARFTMEQFHSIFASLVPLVVVFVGAIPAALTALVGLAGAALAATAALGAVGVLGLGGMALTQSGELNIQPILNRMQTIFDTFITAFTPLMRSFAPIVRNAFTTLENLANPLAAAMAPLTQFRSEFNSLVNTIAGGLPSFTRKVIGFGQAAMPLLSSITDFFTNTDFIGFFADQLARARASLSAIAFGIENFLPALIFLSQGFLNVVGVISLFLGGVGMILKRFPTLTAVLGTVIAGFLALLTVTSLYTLANSAMVASIAGSIASNLQLAGSALYAAASLNASTLSAIAFYSALTLGIAGAVAFASSLDSLSRSLGLVNGKLSKFSELSGGDLSANVSGPGSATGGGFGSSGGDTYVTRIDAGNPDDAARQQYSNQYEQREQVNSVFGG